LNIVIQLPGSRPPPRATQVSGSGLSVIMAEEPLTCVARGGGRVLELIDEHGGDFLAVE